MSTSNAISRKNLWFLLLILLLIATMPRFYHLGELGFYGDEETTALASRSLAEDGATTMPSGMPYRRAISHSWLNAMTSKILGLDNETSYRLASAVFGALTIPLIFLLARPYFGLTVSLMAALLLAFSEWHIAVSREARMYAPFLFFYIATGFCLWHWISTRLPRYLWLSLLFFIFTVSFHTLSIFLVGFIAVPILFRGWSKISIPFLLGAMVVAAAVAHLYSKYFVTSIYADWKNAQGTFATSTAPSEPTGLSAYVTSLHIIDYGLFLMGALLAIGYIRSKMHNKAYNTLDFQSIIHHGLSLLGILLLSLGHFYAAALIFVIYLLAISENPTIYIKQVQKPLYALLGLATLVGLNAIYGNGLIGGIKQLLEFPYPYLHYFFSLVSPVLFFLFVAAIPLLLLEFDQKNNSPIKATLIMTLLPVAAIGVASKWGGIRYVIEAYPFFLLIACYGFVSLVRRIVHRMQWNSKTTVIIASLFACSGIAIGHGIPQAIRIATTGYGYAADSLLSLGTPFYPDHKGPGTYVRSHRQPGDVVIAEDMLQQIWYASKVDYWLRDTEKSASFLYWDKQGTLRDIYTNSMGINRQTLVKLAATKDKRMWLITSGETFASRDANLSPEQIMWLEKIEAQYTPAFIGGDGVSKVYCINC